MCKVKRVKYFAAAFLAFCLTIWGGNIAATAEAETAPSIIEEIQTSTPAPEPAETDVFKQEEPAPPHAGDEQPNDILPTPNATEGTTQSPSSAEAPKDAPITEEAPTGVPAEAPTESPAETQIEVPMETPAETPNEVATDVPTQTPTPEATPLPKPEAAPIEEERCMYQIVFKGWDGAVLHTQTAMEGDAIAFPKPPVREGYAFTTWYMPLSDGDLAVGSDMLAGGDQPEIILVAAYRKLEEQAERQQEEPSTGTVSISSSLKGEATEGCTMVLTAALSDFEGDVSLQWQRCAPNGDWKDIPGATGHSLNVTLGLEDAGASWRLAVTRQ